MKAAFTARPGSVVAFWSGGALAFGLVAGEEKQRVRLVPGRGKDERVNPSRVVVRVTDTGPVPSEDVDERRRAADLVVEIEQRVRAAARSVDVGLVWEIVTEDAEGEDALRPCTLRDLAELALDSATGEAQAAVMVALLADGLRFVRKADAWIPRSRDAVEQLVVERGRVAEREAESRRFFEAMTAVGRSRPFEPSGSEVERRYLEALEQLAVEGPATPAAVRNTANEAFEASRVTGARPHEAAFRLLRRIGVFTSDDENLQLRRFGLAVAFPDEVQHHAVRRCAAGFDEAGRIDLTDVPALSIDGRYTREIDDLLSIEHRAGGAVRLGVHIADPGAFVAPDDAVDREALSRGITFYMPDVRVPMLPPVISEGAASLNPDARRPALSFLVDVGAEGELLGYEVRRSIVRSAARLDYVEANRVISEGSGPFAETLGVLARIAELRRAARRRAGAITILAPEAEIHVGEDGSAELERLDGVSPARLAVSEAMVVVGEVAARFCRDAGVPACYRRQAPPGEPIALPDDDGWDPVAVRRTRRLLKRAEVSLEPARHAGLGLDAYVQASSPLRRYQDLAVHRQIGSVLLGERPCYDAEAMRRIASSTERAESEARKAEQAADEYWMLRYLEDRTGEILEAVVVELIPRPVVQLAETLVEQTMGGLAGVELGQRVRLRVEHVNPRAGVLTLRPV